ncbi:zinc-ribbon domain-containing protein [Qipengyuania sp. XHP0207]|uniref:zinc-ribbon domain-containing protein n=1 Tax=Qipengyuania sp. XHP0207 TaxID=3038078 RepID=UPI00241E8AA4|nr:zinc-ribbon domain-containing protein [Qipengyuania sp. XHP0207]MDG5747792.1 zinc-ribbon domain-containing protein [Qipengyuania sp. XHP0207]
MIIACPACSTRYVVPDSAIGVEGRTVRCAKCKHSWFQDGADAEQVVAAQKRPAAGAGAAPPPPPTIPREATAERPRATREPAPQARDDAGASATKQGFGYSGAVTAHAQGDGPDFDERKPPYGEVQDELPPPPVPDREDDGPSRFDHAPPFRPRRNITKMWTIAAAVFALLALGTIAAVNLVGLPDWMPVAKPLFGQAQPDLELSFPVEEQERRTLPNGTEFFGAKIIVRNTARESRNVPPILIVLLDQRERQVYSWVVNPPQPSLAPGEEITINEAVTDVPKSAVFADIGWAPR